MKQFAHENYSYYNAQSLECSFIPGSDKIFIVICKLGSNSKGKKEHLYHL